VLQVLDLQDLQDLQVPQVLRVLVYLEVSFPLSQMDRTGRMDFNSLI
jgi:hypothetical protein